MSSERGRRDRPPAVAVEVSGVWQTYPGVQALADVSLAVQSGEIVGLVGHNGAGKSTLVRILGGVERPARGRVLVERKPVVFHGPSDAIDAGISVVPQALTLVPRLSVRENLVLGTVTRRRSGTRLPGRQRPRRSGLSDRVRAVAAQLGLNGELDRPAGSCSPSTQRLTMIGRSLLLRPAVMLLDEPTASLHPRETDRMFEAVQGLRDRGMAIVFISHRLEEVLSVSRRILVMRQGRVVAEARSGELTQSMLAELIAGRASGDERLASGNGAAATGSGDVVLRCARVSFPPALRDVSLQAVRGEVLGIAGIEGAGCSDLLRVLAGLHRPETGEVMVNDERLKHTRRAALEAGIAFLPDDRVHNGVVPEMTVAETVTLGHDDEYRLGRFIPILRLRHEAHSVNALLDELDLHPRDAARTKIKLLSGGNQQKALMARALAAGADVYLFDQPTEGVDVSARQELHRQVRDLARRGGAVIVTSSEPDELAELCDRVIVMHAGRVVRELMAEELSESKIVRTSLVG